MNCGTSLPKNVRRATIESVHPVNAAFKMCRKNRTFKLLAGESVLGPPSMEMMAMKRREKPANTRLRHLPPLPGVPATARPLALYVLPPHYEQALFPDFAG
jgi:hypothetical protein